MRLRIRRGRRRRRPPPHRSRQMIDLIKRWKSLKRRGSVILKGSDNAR